MLHANPINDLLSAVACSEDGSEIPSEVIQSRFNIISRCLADTEAAITALTSSTISEFENIFASLSSESVVPLTQPQPQPQPLDLTDPENIDNGSSKPPRRRKHSFPEVPPQIHLVSFPPRNRRFSPYSKQTSGPSYPHALLTTPTIDNFSPSPLHPRKRRLSESHLEPAVKKHRGPDWATRRRTVSDPLPMRTPPFDREPWCAEAFALPSSSTTSRPVPDAPDYELSKLELPSTSQPTELPRTECQKEKVESHLQNIQEILGTVHTPTPPFGDDPCEDHCATNPVSKSGTTSNPSRRMQINIQPSLDYDIMSCEGLVRHKFDLQELPSLIDAILSSDGGGQVFRCPPAGDAQMLIEVIDEALRVLDLSPRTQKKCLKLLYRTCGHHGLLPGALEVPVCYDPTSNALFHGGYADVWKGKHHSQDVAVKVIRMYSSEELRKFVNRFCKEVVMWRSLQHPNILPLSGATMAENRFAMVSEWMPNGNINQFVEAHPEANRLGLLAGVAKGLIYLHSNAMVHGDLKGVNILIDNDGQARLADFGLLAIVSDPVYLISSGSCTQGGTVRWMSPELVDPESFGLEKASPTKSSDCYALGMVIYETISGKLPFYGCGSYIIPVKVMRGERPRWEAKFEESLWKMLELCWASKPNDRPSIEGVLQCLETASTLREPPPDKEELLLREAFVALSL